MICIFSEPTSSIAPPALMTLQSQADLSTLNNAVISRSHQSKIAIGTKVLAVDRRLIDRLARPAEFVTPHMHA